MSDLLLRAAVSAQTGDYDPVKVLGGESVLDSGAVPYAAASVQLPASFRTVLDELDPRADQRVIIVGAEEVAGTGRTFDLGLRARSVDPVARTLVLELAGDEALLMDYAPLAVDGGARAHQSSLRGVVDYVLGKIGAALAPGDVDADVTALSSSTNRVRNPRVAVTTAGWAATWSSGTVATGRYDAGGPADSPSYYFFGGSVAAGAYAYLSETDLSVTAGETYMVSIYARSNSNLTVALQPWLMDASGTIVAVYPLEPIQLTSAWQRLRLRVSMINGASRMRIRVAVVGNLGVNQFVDLTGARVSEQSGDDADDWTYFDGDFADTADYTYSWPTGVGAHAGASTRTPARPAPTPDVYEWRPGTSAWELLRPLTTVAGLRLFCDEARVWRLIDPGTYEVPGFVVVSGFNATAGADTISREDPEIFATGIVIRYTWRGADGRQQVAYDTAGTPEKVVTYDFARPYPGPGAAAAILARRSGSGRTQAVTAAIDWDVTPGMVASITLPSTPEQQGKVARVSFSLGDDALMQVGTRGLIDIPPGSWLDWPPDQAWTQVPDSATWESLPA